MVVCRDIRFCEDFHRVSLCPFSDLGVSTPAKLRALPKLTNGVKVPSDNRAPMGGDVDDLSVDGVVAV